MSKSRKKFLKRDKAQVQCNQKIEKIRNFSLNKNKEIKGKTKDLIGFTLFISILSKSSLQRFFRSLIKTYGASIKITPSCHLINFV